MGALTNLGFTLLTRYCEASLSYWKTAPAAGQRLEPSFHRMRYGGIATPDRPYQARRSAFVPPVFLPWDQIVDRPEHYLTVLLVTGGAHQMFNPMMFLAAEASEVITLRMMKLMLGGRSVRREANLMVSEKIKAAIEATASLAAGASGDEIVHRYRQHVAKNAKRLSGRSRKRTRRRRK